ncbi:host-nuclease inhibitor Gam family protein [Helicobacter winghamensis]|uniref:host-nuclease inhibitor Gam family protein n=1 Tax=Helicobacter winghamensis TaxID=157268 RepID=UPI0027A8A3AD
MKIQSYEEVNLRLKDLASLEVEINRINGEVTLACNKIKEQRAAEIERLSLEKKLIESEIASFCEDNKADFADKRSKEFTFGKIGYKLSKSITGIPRVKEKLEKFLNALKSYGCGNCIAYKEEIDKEALAELDDGTLVKLGVKRVVRDNFRIEPKIEALENAG